MRVQSQPGLTFSASARDYQSTDRLDMAAPRLSRVRLHGTVDRN